jgi:hypothetical protein
VHDPARLRGYAAGEQVVHLVEQRGFRRFRRVHLRVPAAQLPLDVAGLTDYVAQSDRDGVEGVQRDEHVNEVPGRAGPGLGCQGQSGIAVREHQALDEPHHVELGAGDRGIGAVGHRRRDGNRCRCHRRDEPPFPAHVVRGAQHSPGGRAAQGIGGTRGAGDPVGQVRAPARDELELHRAGTLMQAVDMLDEPALHLVGVDTRQRRFGHRLAHMLLWFGGREEIPERRSDLGAYRRPGDDHVDHGH